MAPVKASAVKSYVCSSCFAITKRIESALKPTVCPFCRGTELFDTDPGNSQSEDSRAAPSLPETSVVKTVQVGKAKVEPRIAESDERPCERGEPCARLSGLDCPGGRGC